MALVTPPQLDDSYISRQDQAHFAEFGYCPGPPAGGGAVIRF